MKEFKSVWKQLSKDKEATRLDTFQYCILKAMVAKSEDKLHIARSIIQAAFTPITNTTKLENGQTPYQSLVQARDSSLIYSDRDRPGRLLSVLETLEEVSAYNDLIQKIVVEVINNENEFYSFVLVRTDIPKIHQAVQSTHVGINLGAALVSSSPINRMSETLASLHGLNLVVCGVKNQEELEGGIEYLWSNGYSSVSFYEPDLDNQLTAVASYPVKATEKRFMKRYKPLRMPEAS